MALRTIGNFRLIERIGEGGMGEVYRGFDTMLERDVAIRPSRCTTLAALTAGVLVAPSMRLFQ